MPTKLDVELHPDALVEFEESRDRYLAISYSVAESFLNQVDASMARIVENPKSYEVYKGATRRCPMRKFPFSVFYEVEETRIYVLAVAPEKREPDYWSDRG